MRVESHFRIFNQGIAPLKIFLSFFEGKFKLGPFHGSNFLLFFLILFLNLNFSQPIDLLFLDFILVFLMRILSKMTSITSLFVNKFLHRRTVLLDIGDFCGRLQVITYLYTWLLGHTHRSLLRTPVDIAIQFLNL